MKMQKINMKSMARGAPSGFVISLAVHAAAFLLAGMLVVFNVIKKEEKKFVPPKPIDRPKMKLKKPKVKIKKAAKPKSTARIVTKIKRASMPDIQLPEMSGMGGGIAGTLEGFELNTDIDDISIFGGGQSIGNDFVGTFYDFKRDRNGRPIPMDQTQFADALSRFVKGNWRPSVLSRYYQSPKKLYATCFMVPTIRSILGPRAFGEDTGGWNWMALYRGKLVYPTDIKFRFWGYGDDILLVRVNGELVLNGNYHQDGSKTFITDIGGSWDSTSNDDSRYWYGTNKARVGDWIELKAGELYDMEVMIGEVPGGDFSAMLTVQVEGVEYDLNRQQGPILPMFKTAEPSRSLQDIIYRDLISGEAQVTNGPVFRDYVPSQRAPSVEEVASCSQKSDKSESKMRVWTTVDGRMNEAEYVAVIGDKVTLKSSKGKQLRVHMSKLSEVDREYIELLNPPKFDLDFIKLSNNKIGRYIQSPMELEWQTPPPRVNDFIFGAKVKQKGAGEYKHKLTVEYFAIAQELLGDKYILVDRQSSEFTPDNENNLSHRFKGNPIEFVEYDLDDQMRGMRPNGNLVTITDERGQIIQYSASKSWLWENIEKLKELPVGAYMDETCTRVFPTAPRATRY